MTENSLTRPYRTPTLDEMAVIIARAKKLRSETVFAICAWSAARTRRALRLLISRLTGAFREPAQRPAVIAERDLTY